MPANIQYKVSDSDSRFYAPEGGGGFIDVVNDMPWTLSPKEARKNVPVIRLKEFQQTTGQLIASMIYYARVIGQLTESGVGGIIAKTDPAEVYKYKYFAEPTGFEYVLPYFNPKKLARGNSFGAEDNPFAGLVSFGQNVKAISRAGGGHGGGGLTGFIGATVPSIQALQGVADTMLPGRTGFEFPSSWDNTTLETIEVTIDLFNTQTIDDVIANRKFCHLFSYQNTPSRRNFAIIDPPVIYTLDIADTVQFPACYVSSLNITNLGNVRTMNIEGKDRVIPEAYRISIVFSSLIMPTRNIMQATENGSKVEAISDITPFKKMAKDTLNQVGDVINSFNSQPAPQQSTAPQTADTTNIG